MSSVYTVRSGTGLTITLATLHPKENKKKNKKKNNKRRRRKWRTVQNNVLIIKVSVKPWLCSTIVNL
jgi:hypothetical protein